MASIDAEALAWASILVYLLAVPVAGVWVNASGHDFARVIEMSLCLVCAVALALQRRTRDMGRRAAAAGGALLALAVAATVSAPILPMAWRELCLTLGVVAIARIVARLNKAAHVRSLLATVSLAGAGYASLALLGLAANLSVATALRPYDLLIGYNNGRFFNHVQTAMLPLLAVATLHPFANRAFNRLAALGLAVGIALLVLSEGRATGLALCVGCAAGLALFGRAMTPMLRTLAVACGFAALTYLVFFIALPHLAGMPLEGLHADGVADSGSAHSRAILWRIALDGVARAPWLGIGPMHFSHTWNSDAAHPHNVYLQVADEWGVPMLLVLLVLAGLGLRALYRAVRDHRGEAAERRVGLGLFVAAIAIGVDGMLSGNFVMPVSQVWIAVVIGAAAGWVRRVAPGPARPGPSRPPVVLGCALRCVPLVAMLWLTASVAPELGVHFLDRAPLPGASLDAGAPRFWSNGWF